MQVINVIINMIGMDYLCEFSTTSFTNCVLISRIKVLFLVEIKGIALLRSSYLREILLSRWVMCTVGDAIYKL